ncbi:hypothetical protein ACE1B6_28560 [Aerosakkonemataceae cyanobacterium BLCC-F154]|uniref:Uncharacterized protein n=1 Tax=Floridaenema fluviatile BLCC-F154 TaxID=3153640 RepID=A0ABV4YMD9_9CYAN
MNKILKPKILTFYVGAISFTLILFKAVNILAANYIQASPEIDGNYLFIDSNNLPGCLKAKNLLLSIQQSGIYLNGTLLARNSNQQLSGLTEKRPSLFGKWQKSSEKPLNLSGKVNQIDRCQKQLVKIRGMIKSKTLQGEISLTSFPEKVKFTAVKETTQKSDKQTIH